MKAERGSKNIRIDVSFVRVPDVIPGNAQLKEQTESYRTSESEATERARHSVRSNTMTSERSLTAGSSDQGGRGLDGRCVEKMHFLY